MARTMELTGSPTHRYREVVAVPRSPLYQAYQVLHWGFCALPVIAGLDKFAHLLVNWNQYLAPQIGQLVQANTGITPGQLMMIVGGVEVLAGLLVALKPRIGGYVVALWLAGIIANLIIGMHYFDVALRDFGLMLGAFALGRLGSHFGAAHKIDEVEEVRGAVDTDPTLAPRGLRREERIDDRTRWRHRDDDAIREP